MIDARTEQLKEFVEQGMPKIVADVLLKEVANESYVQERLKRLQKVEGRERVQRSLVASSYRDSHLTWRPRYDSSTMASADSILIPPAASTWRPSWRLRRLARSTKPAQQAPAPGRQTTHMRVAMRPQNYSREQARSRPPAEPLADGHQWWGSGHDRHLMVSLMITSGRGSARDPLWSTSRWSPARCPPHLEGAGHQGPPGSAKIELMTPKGLGQAVEKSLYWAASGLLAISSTRRMAAASLSKTAGAYRAVVTGLRCPAMA